MVEETCDGGEAAFYGINVFGSKAVEIRDSRTFGGFRDAGIYVGNITDTSPGPPVIVAGNETYGNNRGVIVEDSFGVEMRVKGNLVHHNKVTQAQGGLAAPTGLFSHNSDGIRYVDNRIRRNGSYGINLDGGSDDNVFIDNHFRHNPTNLFDQGDGNCGSGNVPRPLSTPVELTSA